MRIIIETIPHSEQRYPTCGDWELDNGTIYIRVSNMGNWRYEAAVAVHEFVEVLLCMDKGIGQPLVDAFDMEFQGEGEPGDDPAAPYHREHCFAAAVERMLIAALGVPWAEYDRAVEALP